MDATMPPPASVLALVVHYGEAQPARRCVESLRASEGVSVRVRVVDHNPVRDSELERLAEYVHAPDNPGFAAGVNRSLRACTHLDEAELIAVLNPDVVVEPSCLWRLAAARRRDPRAGVIGPALLDAGARAPRRWWNVGSEIRWPQAAPASRLHGEAVTDEPLPEQEVDFICGALMAISPRVLREVGLLPEEYGFYFEDAEFCYRVRAAGFSCKVVPQARAYHVGGASFAGREATALYFQVRNRLIFSRRWSPVPWRGRLARGAFVARIACRAVRAAACGRRPATGAYLRALRDGVLRRSPSWT